MRNGAKKLRIWPRATWQNLSQAPCHAAGKVVATLHYRPRIPAPKI